MDLSLGLVGFVVGVIVGMTGMGGGALLTPTLVLGFGVPPLTAVSNDLVVSALMKPVGGLVHLRRGTVHLGLAAWLAIGSVPSAFAGVLVLRLVLGDSAAIQTIIRIALGAALMLAAAGIVLRALVARRRGGSMVPAGATRALAVRRMPTVAVGAIAGLVVGITSVGSGSLVVVALLMLYPALSAARLVGTDLVQAVPLVAAAAIAHLLVGDFQAELTASLLLGSLPGVWIGAHLAALARDSVVKAALAVVLTATGLKLLGLTDLVLP